MDKENYTAKYKVTLWDHFGLDKPDLEKFYYYGNGFRAWFILQHLKDYKPFLTKVTFEKEFSGNLNEGMFELIKESEEKIRKRKKEHQRIKEEQELRNHTIKW